MTTRRRKGTELDDAHIANQGVSTAIRTRNTCDNDDDDTVISNTTREVHTLTQRTPPPPPPPPQAEAEAEVPDNVTSVDSRNADQQESGEATGGTWTINEVINEVIYDSNPTHTNTNANDATTVFGYGIKVIRASKEARNKARQSFHTSATWFYWLFLVIGTIYIITGISTCVFLLGHVRDVYHLIPTMPSNTTPPCHVNEHLVTIPLAVIFVGQLIAGLINIGIAMLGVNFIAEALVARVIPWGLSSVAFACILFFQALTVVLLNGTPSAENIVYFVTAITSTAFHNINIEDRIALFHVSTLSAWMSWVFNTLVTLLTTGWLAHQTYTYSSYQSIGIISINLIFVVALWIYWSLITLYLVQISIFKDIRVYLLTVTLATFVCSMTFNILIFVLVVG